VDSDEILAQQIQQGNTDALASLVKRHHSQLIGYVYRLCGDRNLAEDLTQDAFLRVIRAIHTYHYPQSFKAWLYAIATNLARDHFKRAEMRYRTLDTESASQILEAPDSHLEPIFERLTEAQQVINALMQLSEVHRVTIVLRYYEHFSLQEIADALAIPLGTVKSRLNSGLRHLRQQLEKDFFHDTP
jgi:RNA polymerase sigma-70 factor (ECF subfamily)